MNSRDDMAAFRSPNSAARVRGRQNKHITQCRPRRHDLVADLDIARTRRRRYRAFTQP